LSKRDRNQGTENKKKNHVGKIANDLLQNERVFGGADLFFSILKTHPPVPRIIKSKHGSAQL